MTLTELVFKIRSDAHLFCQATERSPDIRIVVTQTAWDESARASKFLITVAGPGPRVADLVREADKLYDNVEIVKQAAEQTTFRATATLERLRATSNPFAFTLEHFGERAIVGPALLREGHLNVRLVVTGKVDLALLLADYEKGAKAGRWNDFKLVRVDDFDPEQQVYGAFTEGLTQKQLEVIKTALALGFYNTPRNVTLDDLANIFGISKAAVHNRLQAAERKVIAKFFG